MIEDVYNSLASECDFVKVCLLFISVTSTYCPFITTFFSQH